MKFIIIGHGGHSKVISDLILSNKENEIVGFIDDKYEEIELQNNLYYGPILSAKKMAEYFNDIKFIIAIGDNKIRKFIENNLDLPKESYASVIHKSAIVSLRAKIGIGTVIMPNAVINAGAKIGDHVIINTGAIVEHDCKIADFAHISPNATLTGAVQIREGVSIGAGAQLIPNVCVGEWTVVGAGATVIQDLPAGCIAVGSPAKVKNRGELIV